MGFIDINVKPSTIGFVVVGAIVALLGAGELMNRLDSWLGTDNGVGDTYITIALFMILLIIIVFLLVAVREIFFRDYE